MTNTLVITCIAIFTGIRGFAWSIFCSYVFISLFLTIIILAVSFPWYDRQLAAPLASDRIQQNNQRVKRPCLKEQFCCTCIVKCEIWSRHVSNRGGPIGEFNSSYLDRPTSASSHAFNICRRLPPRITFRQMLFIKISLLSGVGEWCIINL